MEMNAHLFSCKSLFLFFFLLVHLFSGVHKGSGNDATTTQNNRRLQFSKQTNKQKRNNTFLELSEDLNNNSEKSV